MDTECDVPRRAYESFDVDNYTCTTKNCIAASPTNGITIKGMLRIRRAAHYAAYLSLELDPTVHLYASRYDTGRTSH